MEIINVGIMSTDSKYAKALAKALSKEPSPAMFFLLENEEDVLNCGDVHFDIILTDKDTPIENTVMLVNKQELENLYGEPPFAVFKYVKSGSFINDLLFVYFKLTGRRIESFNSCGSKVIAFCQLEGGSGATSLSIATAMMMHRLYGSKVLYMNIDSFDDSIKYFGRSQTTDVIRLLYYLESEKDFPVETFIKEYCKGLDYIDNSLFGLSLNSAEPDVLVKLINKVKTLKQYDFIILDVGKSIGFLQFSLKKNISTLCLINQQHCESFFLITNPIIDSITKLFNESNIMRIDTAFNPIDYSNVDQSHFFIEYGDSVFNTEEDKVTINLNNNFGTQVKTVTVALKEG